MAGEASRRNGKKGGRPKHKATLDKLAAREFVRQQVTAQLGPLIEAQLANAKGLKYLVVRDSKTGKFVRVGEAVARATQGSTEEVIEVWEKDPNVPAYIDLLNRALDKPADQAQAVTLSGTLSIRWQDEK